VFAVPIFSHGFCELLNASDFLPFDYLFQKTVIAYQLIHVLGAEMHLMILEMKKPLSKKQK
jgi:hypothetical protein